jgi:DNA-binding NarL/FixJ family response regulator
MLRILLCSKALHFVKSVEELIKNENSNYLLQRIDLEKGFDLYAQKNEFDVIICCFRKNEIDELNFFDSSYFEKNKVIIICEILDYNFIQKAKNNGITALLTIETKIEELIKIIELKMPMNFYSNSLIYTKNDELYSKIQLISKKFNLSKQEIEILILAVKGIPSKEIANRLNISKSTVDTHRRNINRKLEITNKSTLYQFAYENELLR